MTAPPLDPPTTPEQPPVRAAEAVAEVPTDPAGVPGAAESAGFTVRLANFTGPFDLLLQLIGKHKLDVTEVALHRVTDEFIAYIRAMGDQWDLDEASEFLLIAATLLDLKAARLLPAAEVEDEEDLALLEARDLLFARLLQYKAYKEAAAHIAALEEVGGRRYPRAVTLEARYADALPDLVLGIGPERLLKLAVRAMTPKPVPEVSIAHVHMVRVSVREHAGILTERLRRAGTATFSLLCADCEATLEVVARFLALLELYREGLVAFVQEQALEELTVRWTGPAEGGPDLHVDEYAGTPPEPAPTVPEPAGSGPLPAASAERRPVPDGTADDIDPAAVAGVAADDTGSAAAHTGSAEDSGTAPGVAADGNGTTTEERAG
ncbi:segregation and condensation protein A [Micromonospora sp. DT178]|uniref:segregation and condensation protein A n=1 Tax=Micromonospora sp. DT178 TaxID=3393436 RepID=UPI003CF1A56F